MKPVRPRTTLAVLVSLLALVVAACSSGPDTADERLAAAFEDTFGDRFGYRVSIRADRASLDALGEGAGDAALFLNGLQLSGVVDGNDAASVALTVLGQNDIVELRIVGEDELYVRADLPAIAAATGIALPTAAEIRTQLGLPGLPASLADAAAAGIAGGWIGITGLRDAIQEPREGLSPSLDPDEVEGAVRELLGEDIAGFFGRYVVVEEEQDANGQVRYDVSLQLTELVRTANQLNERFGMGGAFDAGDLEADLADLPDVIPGTVVVESGKVTQLVFDVADTVRQLGQEIPGTVEIVIEIDHRADEVGAPADATIVPAKDIEALVAQFMGGLGGLPTDLPSDFPTDFDGFPSDFPTELFSDLFPPGESD